MSIEERSSPENCTLVLTANKDMKGDNKFVPVTVSNDFITVFQTSAIVCTLKFTEPLKILLAII